MWTDFEAENPLGSGFHLDGLIHESTLSLRRRHGGQEIAAT
jgi:hypothetical protein